VSDPKPIEFLSDQEVEPSTDLIGRVRRSIQRRSAASQVATFTWQLPRLVLLEMVKAFGEMTTLETTKKGPGQ